MTDITEVSTLTTKGQASIPAVIRKDLNLRPGDKLIWQKHEDGSITVNKATAEDIAWRKFTYASLQDWNDPGDEVYNDL